MKSKQCLEMVKNMKNFFNNLKEKVKSYGFWVSLSSAVVLLLTSLGNMFGFSVENQIVEDVIMSIAGVLVVLGIVSMNTKPKDSPDDQTEDGISDESKSDNE